MGMALAAYECRGRSEADQRAFLHAAAQRLANARPTTAKRMAHVCETMLEAAEDAWKRGEPVDLAVKARAIEANNSRYRSLFSKSVYDYRGWAIGLQKAGYATATTYASALIGFIDSYRLYDINGGVKLRAGKTVVITRKATATQKATFDASCQAAEDEVSEEEEVVVNAVKRYVVDINDVRCTILYPGMTLSSIAMKYDIPKEKLLEFNEVASEKDFHEGDIVFIAKKKSKFTGAQDFYHVREGDTLYGISQNFGIKFASLAKMNNKDIFSQLKEGEKIKLK
jgi:LysM repeat protein